jgi:hypothetical protein
METQHTEPPPPSGREPISLELVEIDITTNRANQDNHHLGIRVGGLYVVRANGAYHMGTFRPMWYGWNFQGWSLNPVGLQLSGCQRVWSVLNREILQ